MRNTRNNTIKGLTIDMNGANNFASSSGHFFSYPIFAVTVSHLLIEGNTIVDNPGTNDIIATSPYQSLLVSAHCVIRNNTLVNGGTALYGNIHQIDYSAIYTNCIDSVIEANVIRSDAIPFAPHGAIEVHASNGRIVHNSITLASVGTYLSSDFSGRDLNKIEVRGNNYRDVLVGISFFTNADNANFSRIDIRGNSFRLKQFENRYFARQSAIGISQPRDNNGRFNYTAIIKESRFENNFATDDTSPPRSSSFMRLSATNQVTVRGNKLERMGLPGICVIGSPYGTRQLFVDKNLLIDFGLNQGPFNHEAIYFDLTGSSTLPAKEAYDADGVFIRNNTFIMRSPTTSANAYFLDWSQKSRIQRLVIAGNRARNIGQRYTIGPRAKEAIMRNMIHDFVAGPSK
jgi:hypothetical protein